MSTVVILPCAGEGRRLGAIQPKELHFVGGAPLIQYAMRQAMRAGVQRFVIVANEAHAETVCYMQRWCRSIWGVTLAVAMQQTFEEVEGLPAAMLSAWEYIEPGDRVSLVMPDTICRPPTALAELVRDRAPLSIGVFPVTSCRFGMAELSIDGMGTIRIMSMADKPPVWRMLAYAWGLFSWTEGEVDMRSALAEAGPTVTDSLWRLLEEGNDYGVHQFTGYYDVATRADLEAVGQMARQQGWSEGQPAQPRGGAAAALRGRAPDPDGLGGHPEPGLPG